MASIKSIENYKQRVRIDLSEVGENDAFIEMQEPTTDQMFEMNKVTSSNDKEDTMLKWYKNNMASLIVDHDFTDAKDNNELVKYLVKNWKLFSSIVGAYSSFLGSLNKEDKE